MASKKHYTGDFDAWEKKLARVCERLGVPEEGCRYDWTSSRGGNSCYVEICIAGVWRRFDNSTEKSAACGRGLIYASDLFAAIVLTLEDMARAAEQGIVSFDQLVTGIPALPAAQELEPCFQALGFTERPASVSEVEAQYKRMAKVTHPDVPGGSHEAFRRLRENYNECMDLLGQ